MGAIDSRFDRSCGGCFKCCVFSFMAPYAGITQFRFDGSRCLLLSAQTVGLPERRYSTSVAVSTQPAKQVRLPTATPSTMKGMKIKK